MTVYFVTGGLGSGKGLAAMYKIRDYANNGVKIAGNLDVYLEHLCTNKNSKLSYTRVPDRPTKHDLESLGSGNEGYDPYENSLLVLDELATWFNSRTWNEKGRAEILDWLLHSRKHGWDVILIVQSIETIDKQLIEGLMGNHVPMSDLSQINVPLIGRLWRQFSPKNRPLKLPKIHTGTVLYKNKVRADKWTFRGRDLYKTYDTKQIFNEVSPFNTHSMLSRWHLEGRYNTQIKGKNLIAKYVLFSLVKLAFFITCQRNKRTAYQYMTR